MSQPLSVRLNPSPVTPARVQPAYARQLAERVGDQLVEWERRLSSRPDATTREAYAAKLIVDELEREDRAQITRGLAPMSDDILIEVRRAVLAQLFRPAAGIDHLLNRVDIANIHIHGTNAWLEMSDGEVVEYGPIAESSDEVVELIRRLASQDGRTPRQFNENNPLLSMRLSGGQRLSAVMGVSSRVEVTIRLKTLRNVTLDDLVRRGTLNRLSADFCRALVVGHFNLVVSGGPNAGKTTTLIALCDCIPLNERLVTIEDVLELDLRSERRPLVVDLETRQANVEGVGEITQEDLAKHALRLSPKRVIVGEVRGNEVQSMCAAMTMGLDGSACTVHAESSDGALSRLRMYLGEALQNTASEVLTDRIAQSVHFVLHVEYDHQTRSRKVASIREVIGSRGTDFVTTEVFARSNRGELEVSGVLSDRSRRKLESVGFDTRRIAGSR